MVASERNAIVARRLTARSTERRSSRVFQVGFRLQEPGFHSGNRRLAGAVCLSLLFHALLFGTFDQRHPAIAEALFTAPWPGDLSVTFRLPPSPHSDSDQETLEKTQMKIDVRFLGKTPTEHSDAGNQSVSIPAGIAAPVAASEAGDHAAESGSSAAIDIDAARRIARQMARAQGQSPATQHPRHAPPAIERDTPLGQAIARSARSDCRRAYAGAGLFAIPLLIRDAVADGGCKW